MPVGGQDPRQVGSWVVRPPTLVSPIAERGEWESEALGSRTASVVSASS